MSYLAIAYAVEEESLAQEKRFRDRINPLNVFSQEEVLHYFGLKKEQIIELANEIKNDCDPKSGQWYTIDTLQALFITLRFLKTGSFQYIAGELIKVHQSTASRKINLVTNAILKNTSKYIKFPAGNELIVQLVFRSTLLFFAENISLVNSAIFR